MGLDHVTPDGVRVNDGWRVLIQLTRFTTSITLGVVTGAGNADPKFTSALITPRPQSGQDTRYGTTSG
jgi:hypothetical protein